MERKHEIDKLDELLNDIQSYSENNQDETIEEDNSEVLDVDEEFLDQLFEFADYHREKRLKKEKKKRKKAKKAKKLERKKQRKILEHQEILRELEQERLERERLEREEEEERQKITDMWARIEQRDIDSYKRNRRSSSIFKSSAKTVGFLGLSFAGGYALGKKLM
jgi:exonuclease VII large subunit